MLDFSPKELDRFRKIGEVVQVARHRRASQRARSRSPARRRSPRSSRFPATPTSSSASTSRRLRARRHARSWPTSCATRCCRPSAAIPTSSSRPSSAASRSTASPTAGSSTRAAPISWNLDEIRAGELIAELPDGTTKTLLWNEVALDPGWCKLDWVVSDPIRRQLSNASNVIDVTWEDAGRADRAARRLPGCLLPGGLPRLRRGADLPEGRQVRHRRRAGRLRGPHRAGDPQVPHEAPELRQGREADVQRVPPHRAVHGCRVRARALRRADHDPVPGLVAHPHPRERDQAGVVDPDPGGAGAGGQAHPRRRAGTGRRRREPRS